MKKNNRDLIILAAIVITFATFAMLFNLAGTTHSTPVDDIYISHSPVESGDSDLSNILGSTVLILLVASIVVGAAFVMYTLLVD